MPTLNWIGKDKVINHHKDVPFKILEPVYTFANGEFVDGGTSENKIIHGDNLEALKALLPEYEGKVNCIYIDVPYNTGNEGWVYNDNVNHPKLKKWLGEVVGKEGEDLSRHDKWLCMIYPRLKLLHRLLKEDGAIFISIDDNEQASLKLICDEIFGAGNFVDTIIWQKNFAPKNSAKYFSANHEFILCYAKSKDKWNRNLLPRDDAQNDRYKNPDNDPRGPWTSGDLSARNPYSLGIYPITSPSGRTISGPPKGTYWRVSKEKFNELDTDNRIWWGTNGSNVPRLKRFLSEIQQGVVPLTIWQNTEVGNTQDAKKEINAILHDKDIVFDTPKPVKLIERILQIATDNDAVVLDSFAGSGTTAHAVINLNLRDGGNRKFVLVEIEDYATTLTAERVRRVVEEAFENKKEVTGRGLGFTFYNLGEQLFDPDNELNEVVPLKNIREYIYFTETGAFLNSTSSDNAYYMDTHNGISYYFYYEKDSLTTLDLEFLGTIAVKADQYVIYADNCLLPEALMTKHNIIFKKIPRDITRF
jgi:adenine-specific DNA-methyltransferase